MNYRHKICVNVIRFPEGFEEENRGLKKGCCENELVLASSTDTEDYKNDVKGIAVKISDIGDIVDFELVKCDEPDTVLPNLGEALDCPEDELVVGYIYDWRQILLAYGAGHYAIKITFTISGVPGGYTHGNYTLKEFTIANAAETVRVYSEFRSKYLKLNMDFTNSNYKDSVRFNGFFGNRQPKTEVNNLVSKGLKVEKTKRENLNEFTLETDPIGVCISRQLLDWHFLNEDKCLITDHNRTNHDYLLFNKGVVLTETPEMEYKKGNRLANLTAKLGDRELIDISYYNAP